MALTKSRFGVLSDGPRPWRWSVGQYHQLADSGWFDEKRVELIEGEIVEMPPIGDEHRSVGMGVVRPLLTAFGPEFEISVQSSLVLNDESEPEPDVVIARGSWRDFVEGLPISAVVLVVEISKSTLQNDLIDKAMLYAQSEIPEYWVIDLVNSELVVHRTPDSSMERARYTEVRHLKKGEIVAALHAPNSPIAVSDLLP